jgi:predicted O-methyltransferase YrrM
MLPRLRRKAIERWEAHRPLPRARYERETPRVGTESGLTVYFPPNPPTLAAASTSTEAADFVMSVLKKLTPDPEVEHQSLYYQWGRAKFGGHWRSADIATTLRAAALFVRPQSYLEIGVRRGRSAAVVAATCPGCDIYGFDLWEGEYAGADNPGPDLVRTELRAVGHTGELTLVVGDSAQTVPAFLTQHPQLFFELITVDGDHSVLAAARDLTNTLPRLKVGGILVFDDICSAPLLQSVWRRIVQRDRRFVTWEFTDAGYGVAAAIRISDQPVIMGTS